MCNFPIFSHALNIDLKLVLLAIRLVSKHFYWLNITERSNWVTVKSMLITISNNVYTKLSTCSSRVLQSWACIPVFRGGLSKTHSHQLPTSLYRQTSRHQDTATWRKRTRNKMVLFKFTYKHCIKGYYVIKNIIVQVSNMKSCLSHCYSSRLPIAVVRLHTY